jgi:hypothetical protein
MMVHCPLFDGPGLEVESLELLLEKFLKMPMCLCYSILEQVVQGEAPWTAYFSKLQGTPSHSSLCSRQQPHQ